MRCRFDSKYECRELIKVGHGKWDYHKGCNNCEIYQRTGQKTFIQKESEKMSDEFSKLHDKALEQLESVPLSDIPDQAKLKVLNLRFKNNKAGNEAAYLYLKTTNGMMITQMYPRSSWKELDNCVAKAGGWEVLKTGFYDWKKHTFGRLQFDRLYPEPKPKEKKA